MLLFHAFHTWKLYLRGGWRVKGLLFDVIWISAIFHASYVIFLTSAKAINCSPPRIKKYKNAFEGGNFSVVSKDNQNRPEVEISSVMCMKFLTHFHIFHVIFFIAVEKTFFCSHLMRFLLQPVSQREID